MHLLPPKLFCLFAVAAAPQLLAQSRTWYFAGDDLPESRLSFYARMSFYDLAEQRLVVLSDMPGAAWTLDGSRWRRITPSGLEDLAAPGAILQSAVFDEASGRAIVTASGWVGGGPFIGRLNPPFAGRGPGFEMLWGSSVVPYFGAAVAFDPNLAAPIQFGGADAAGLASDQMLRWTGTDWALLAPAVRPAPRSGAAMAVDRARGRVVLFGGIDNLMSPGAGNLFRDTWEWDGVTWTQRQPATSPPARLYSAAYDPAAQRVALLGGVDPATYMVFGDHWEFDGSQWVARAALPLSESVQAYEDGAALHFVVDDGSVYRHNSSVWTAVHVGAPRPGHTYGACVAYDPTRNELLLTGGQAVGGTWTWNGAWQHRASVGGLDRGHAALAALGTGMVLFGGLDSSPFPIAGAYDETWRWNGQSWAQLQPATRPAHRWAHAMVNTGSALLLFGGSDHNGMLGDTWRFDGVNWSALQPVNAPAARSSHGFAYDPVRQRAVLFGGYSSTSAFVDTWEWDGLDWAPMSSTQQPSASDGRMCYDAAAGAVLHVGAGPQAGGDFYWDGVDWTQVASSGYPGMHAVNLAYDDARQRPLLVTAADPRVWSVSSMIAAADVNGSYCGNDPDVRLLGRPAIGTAADVHLEGAASVAAFVVYGLGSSGVNWAPSCYQLVTADAVRFGALDALGHLDVPLVVPLDPTLRGVTLQVQAVVVDGGPVFGASLSNALWLRIGD